jgi:hypothetical protein
MDDRQRREWHAGLRREEARLRREIQETEASYKKYPEVGDPPPGKIKFAFAMTGFALAVIAVIVMCGAVVWMFARLP